MRIRLNVTRLAGAWEATIDIDREPSSKERAIWAAEEEHRYLATIEAIAAAPESAQEIAERALGTDGN